MDKNTLWGLLLMGAIFFGFMHFNKPAQTSQDAPAAAQTASAADTTAAEADSLSAADLAALAQAVKAVGNRGADGAYVIENAELSLRADSLSLTGHVTVNNKTVDVTLLGSAPAADLAPLHARAAAIARDFAAKAQKYNSLARNLSGEETVTVLENDKIRVGISSRGGMVSSVVLKDYNTEVGDTVAPVELFKGATDGYGFILTTADQRFNTREFNFTPVVESDSSVMMTLDLGAGVEWGIRYALRDDYLVSMELVQKNAGQFLPASTASIVLEWNQTMARNEKGRTFEERQSGVYYKYVGENPDDLNANKDADEELSGHVKWVAFKNQFFSSVIIPRQYFSTADLSSKVIKDGPYLKDMHMLASMPYTTADGVAAAFDFYFGPNDYPLLSSLDDTLAGDQGEDLQLTHLIPLGWGLFRYINTWVVIPVFTFLSSFISSYGLIILLLTVFIKLILFPFTFKSFKSQARMRLLQPEIKQINAKYPGQENAMKRQQETMALYQRSGASPFSGCLPMLLQMPVLIAMFSFFPSAIELRGQSFLWAHDLSAPDFIITLPFSIPFYGNGVSLFCLLMTAVNIVYMHINMQNQPQQEGMPGMKMMTYIMPVMFLFIFNDYASGLSYYYFLSLLITIVQTWCFRHFMDEDKVRAEMLANAKKPRKKSGFMARLEEAQRQQQAALRQQQAAQGKKRR